MSVTVGEFTPSVEILGTDTIANTDDKLRTIMDDVKNYLENNTQSAIDQTIQEIDDYFTQKDSKAATWAEIQANEAKVAADEIKNYVLPEEATYNLNDLETALNGLLTQLVAQQAQINILINN